MPSFRQPGTVFTDHFFEVPLAPAAPDGEQITVFAREMVAVEQSGRENLPWLLYLQGGPGRPSPRPVSRKLGWLDRALRDYRLLLLDQRGTGRSTPANPLTLAARGPAQERAGYLPHFRAASIWADAGLVLRPLIGRHQWRALV